MQIKSYRFRFSLYITYGLPRNAMARVEFHYLRVKPRHLIQYNEQLQSNVDRLSKTVTGSVSLFIDIEKVATHNFNCVRIISTHVISFPAHTLTTLFSLKRKRGCMPPYLIGLGVSAVLNERNEVFMLRIGLLKLTIRLPSRKVEVSIRHVNVS